MIVTPLYVSVEVVAPDSVRTLAAHASAFAASVTPARARSLAEAGSAALGTAPMLAASWPPNHGWMSAV